MGSDIHVFIICWDCAFPFLHPCIAASEAPFLHITSEPGCRRGTCLSSYLTFAYMHVVWSSGVSLRAGTIYHTPNTTKLLLLLPKSFLQNYVTRAAKFFISAVFVCHIFSCVWSYFATLNGTYESFPCCLISIIGLHIISLPPLPTANQILISYTCILSCHFSLLPPRTGDRNWFAIYEQQYGEMGNDNTTLYITSLHYVIVSAHSIVE